jgi:hypothetical protein
LGFVPFVQKRLRLAGRIINQTAGVSQGLLMSEPSFYSRVAVINRDVIITGGMDIHAGSIRQKMFELYATTGAKRQRLDSV